MTFTFENVAVFLSFLLYASVGIGYLSKANYPWALIWFSYAIANLGLIWAASVGSK